MLHIPTIQKAVLKLKKHAGVLKDVEDYDEATIAKVDMVCWQQAEFGCISEQIFDASNRDRLSTSDVKILANEYLGMPLSSMMSSNTCRT